jgi:hypothetical protein
VRKKHLLPGFAIVLAAAVAFIGFSPVSAEQQKKTSEPLITILNPEIESRMVDRIPLPPRLDKLEGKTIYMVDINWGGPDAAYSVFEEIQSWFEKNMPGVKTEIRRKSGMYTTDDPGLWKEIQQNGHAAIIGIAG